MGPLLCVFLGLFVPFVAMGFLLQAGLRPLAAASAYRSAAWRMGLEADTRGVNLRGHLEGRRLFVGLVVDAHGKHHQAVLDLAFPLGMGLLVRRKGYRALRLRRRPTLSIGDPNLDRRLEVRAFDLEGARALLGPSVRPALLTVLARWPHLEITDHWVRVKLRRAPSRERDLLALVEALAGLAIALEDARRSVAPGPQARAVGDAWVPLAASMGLSVDATLPSLIGTVRGRVVSVHLVRMATGYAADLAVRRVAALRLGLRVVPHHNEDDDDERVGQDLLMGDPTFDRAFLVQGWDAARVIGLLGPSVRPLLLDLARHGTTQLIDDHQVRAEGVSPEPAPLAAAIDAAVAGAEALDEPTLPAS